MKEKSNRAQMLAYFGIPEEDPKVQVNQANPAEPTDETDVTRLFPTPFEGSERRSLRVSTLMKGGKRGVAASRVHERRMTLRAQGVVNPVNHVEQRREAIMPSVQTISMKRGGSSYQVPHPRPLHRRRSFAVRWLVDGSRARRKKGIGITQALRREFSAIGQDQRLPRNTKSYSSYAMNKKITMHRTAKSNRVFVHMRWR